MRAATGIVSFALVVTVVVVACASPPAASDAEQAADLVTRFYAGYIRHPHSGLPSARELDEIRPFLSARLQRLFDAAIHYQQEWIRKNPDRPAQDGRPAVINKPPLVEGGEWFASLYEWPDGVESLTGDEPAESFEVVDTVRWKRDVWHVRGRYAYATKPEVTWVDTFVVIRENGRSVIDDVIYSDAGVYYRSGRLSEFIDGPWE